MSEAGIKKLSEAMIVNKYKTAGDMIRDLLEGMGADSDLVREIIERESGLCYGVNLDEITPEEYAEQCYDETTVSDIVGDILSMKDMTISDFCDSESKYALGYAICNTLRDELSGKLGNYDLSDVTSYAEDLLNEDYEVYENDMVLVYANGMKTGKEVMILQEEPQHCHFSKGRDGKFWLVCSYYNDSAELYNPYNDSDFYMPSEEDILYDIDNTVGEFLKNPYEVEDEAVDDAIYGLASWVEGRVIRELLGDSYYDFEDDCSDYLLWESYSGHEPVDYSEALEECKEARECEIFGNKEEIKEIDEQEGLYQEYMAEGWIRHTKCKENS